ncbi:hypothetical protein OIDMADRAFT_19024 [Oidiodendron maius Zn]|uniref:Uncharacterized protein n=1 Tax=Oidiodendron maius (strain Zn) TaxID=913774 RepID=A0A0C3HF37_OIDMZ|nr:hypothetical protein OIDMADRAFT_19024 [Oidiodendron maius Zn]
MGINTLVKTPRAPINTVNPEDLSYQLSVRTSGTFVNEDMVSRVLCGDICGEKRR